MDILPKTIYSLSKKEIINYKIYTKRTKVNQIRKDVALFDFLKKQGAGNSNNTQIFEALYHNVVDKSSFYRLKSRLLTEIDNSLVQFYFHETDISYIYSELSLYTIFCRKNEWSLACHHIEKAEKKALQIQDFSVLDLIYKELINLSINYDTIAPEVYIKKREDNQRKLYDLSILDNALAKITYDLKRTQNFSKTKNNTLIPLNNAIKAINENKGLKNNPIFKRRLFAAISHVLLSTKDYVSLELYATKTYREFIKKRYFNKENHALKLQILRYICNTLFINEKHKQALEYIKKLKTAMSEFNNLLYNDNVFFYYNALANNYTTINPKKAIEILNEAKTIHTVASHPTHLGYIYLNLAGANFDLKHYKAALKNIINLYHHKVFENLDQSFKLKIEITEIILRIETHDLDYAANLIAIVSKKHKPLLSTLEYKQDADFLVLIKKLIEKYSFEKTKKAMEWVTKFQKTSYKYHSTSIVSYNKWFNEKYTNE